jgi:hypothetical protein
MQDLIAKGEAWFEQQRREHLAATVEYRPADSLLPRTCRATLVVGRWEAVDSAGQIVRLETRDFFIHRDDLPQDPKRGDKIAVDENGSEKLYEVSIPDGSRNAWRWADRSETVRRIHTMAVSNPSPLPAGPMLVRAIGVSTESAITDAQIKAQLTLEMGTTRALTRQLVAASAYVYVVLPVSFGEPTIKVNGIPSSAWETVTRSIDFTGQASTSYKVFRSTYAITGSPLVEVI